MNDDVLWPEKSKKGFSNQHHQSECVKREKERKSTERAIEEKEKLKKKEEEIN